MTDFQDMYVAYEGQVLLCLKRIRIQAHYGKPDGPGSEIAWCTDHIVGLVKKLYNPDNKFPARPAAQPFPFFRVSVDRCTCALW